MDAAITNAVTIRTSRMFLRSCSFTPSVNGFASALGNLGQQRRKPCAPRALFGFGKNTKGGKTCTKCKGEKAVMCSGCKGSGKNKKNGNLFERWKCYDCQGFGLVRCPSCGKEGLTPEQRGER